MSSTSEPITQIQSHLEEDLYFLRRRSPLRLYQRTNPPLEARLLDVVALFLATGESNPTLATFWWGKEAKLYIAKSPPSDSQNDATIAKAFFDDLRQAQGFESMIPFLATHSQASVNKRICHLRQSLSNAPKIFCDSDDTEDPVNRLKNILTFEPPFAFDDSESAMSTFKELVVISRRVLDAYDLAFSYRYHDARACRLQRHLDKMAQYLRIGILIKFWKKHGKYIDITWIPAIELGGTARTLTMKTVMSRYSTVISGKFDSSPEELRGQIMWLSGLLRSMTIIPHVHAVISLILYVSENVGLQHLQQHSQDDSKLLIGSNKTSCLACTCWRRAFNSALGLNWETTCTYSQSADETTWETISSNCVPRSDWSIPYVDNNLPLRGIDPGTLRRLYEAVLTCVQGEVKALFEKELVIAHERISYIKCGSD